MKHLYLSPHYDDAIYSCGGTIYQQVQSGDVVEIMTIMAGAPTMPIPDTPVLKDNHDRWDIGENPVIARRKEDKMAGHIVGATTTYLDLPDCIYRIYDGEALYATEDSLWRNIHPDDPAVSFLQTLVINDADIIYAPLGVGAHVDHLIVRDWAWVLAQNGQMPVQFYVEYPYMRDQTAVENAYTDFPTALETVQRPFDEIAMQHKIQAMRAYQSQIKSFWDDERAISGEIRQTFDRDGQFVEIYAQPLY